MPQERLANLAYCMISKEANKGVPVKPAIGMPLIEESIITDPNFDDVKMLVGNKAARQRSIMGQRSHMGDIQTLAEPNSLGYLFDMLLTRTGTTGSGPYTHSFALSATQNPNSYTIEFLKGQVVWRYFGVESRELGIKFDKNKGVATSGLTARGVYSAGAITNVATNTLTLDSSISATPTLGLVTGDVVRIFLANGSTVDTTISSLTNTTVTVASAGAAAAGDILCLRSQTAANSFLDPILWSSSEYRFAADAATALTATHTPIEAGSGEWKVMHSLKSDGGEQRSGSVDPVSLARTTGDVEIKTTNFFDTPSTERDFMLMKKRALVARHFVGSQYELRLTLNNLKASAKATSLKIDDLIYEEVTWKPEQDTTDGQMFGVTVINGVSTL